jgi:hypothetical protein
MQLKQNIIAEEIQNMEYEPLLPIEKKLIVWSLGLGVIFLVILYMISVIFFLAA